MSPDSGVLPICCTVLGVASTVSILIRLVALAALTAGMTHSFIESLSGMMTLMFGLASNAVRVSPRMLVDQFAIGSSSTCSILQLGQSAASSVVIVWVMSVCGASSGALMTRMCALLPVSASAFWTRTFAIVG